MERIGFSELALILLVIIVLFGAKRIPEVFKSVGQGLKEFKDAMDGKKKDDDVK
ncbi:MAG: twin-arginine translocase TatA/TatE family subunit [Endomicrobiales bacterium]|jgi:sec-independent protein translocase protein TatA